MFTRYTVTTHIDCEEQVLMPGSGPRVEIHLQKGGVIVTSGNTAAKVVQVECKMTPGGLTEEEYRTKLHEQIHREHEAMAGGPVGGNEPGGKRGPTTH